MDTSVLKASVVIPTVGRVPLLRQCVESVLDCRPGAAEVILVDQSHGDEVAGLVEDIARPELQRVEDRGRGIGRALNIGLRVAQHPVVLVTHDDCTVRQDWVDVASRLMSARPSLLVTGRVEPWGGGCHVPSCKSDLLEEEHQGGSRHDMLYCNNWAAVTQKILGLGGFDERAGLGLAAEDCDFCFRWTAQGRPIRYEPDMVVWHQDWRSETTLRRTYRTYGRGLGAFYAKHLLEGHWRLLKYLALDLARGAQHSWRGRLKGEPPGLDVDRGLLLGLPVGLVSGAVEELRSSRRPPAS